MGREIRRVPPNWEHPKNERGHYIPLEDSTHLSAIWRHIRYDVWWYLKHPKEIGEWFECWPKAEWYRPRYTSKPTHFQMYETVSEGTPVSPVFATLDKLEAWLIEQGHSPRAAHAFVQDGWAPSFVMRVTPEGLMMQQGIEACGSEPDEAQG